jgi:hypothetical protein
LNYFKWGKKLTLQNNQFQHLLPIENDQKTCLECVQGPFSQLLAHGHVIWVEITKLAKTLKISNSNYHSLNPNLAPLSIIYIAFFCWKKP